MRKHTLVLKAADPCGDRAVLEKAAAILREGGLVVFATETVYGIGANALDEQAVSGIFEAKGRPQDNPLIVHIARWDDLPTLAREIPPAARLLAAGFWPGPLTMILESSGAVAACVSGGLNTVAVRMPSHPVARELIRLAGVPVAAPSANRSGRPSPTTARHCFDDLSGRVDIILDSGSCPVGVESTVITLAGGTPRVLRPGAVTVEQLREVLGEVEVDAAVLHHVEEGAAVASPGMKYQHYAPRADIQLVHATGRQFREYVQRLKGEGVCALAFDEDCPHIGVPCIAYGAEDDPASQAERLFAALHELDQAGAKRVYARAPNLVGVGLAVYNRLIRAAAFEEIYL